MAATDVEGEPVYVFVLDGTYVFKYYFGSQDLFDALSDYYDGEEYRFEVPERDWESAAEALRDHGYGPVVVDEPVEFVVVKEQYTKHAEVLKHSVENWTRRGHHFFLMKDPLAVERAVREHGATPASETDLAVGV